ncbi:MULTISPECIES: outer membrane beta-barrel protein [unclassified Leeuwenhoekiella]|uniref:outer membrane beta-barrel protein n=1 Tax=unclassified Leeuwenhoekiella TaxID=2615029 RepID=UPI000C429175|nr:MULTISPECIES: outer membrane beta-barrel protein [unclassified Leeuwenhoekiella]MBA80459.1 TonB-dependent receptor [Leeuwenhoekiella sp.]|tara:strand:- start:44639 stop:47440 length:2802 start_codon:yes stop_codon:yes gene_type:complete
MNNRFLLSLILGLLSFYSYSQDFTITGRLIDQEQKTPLEAATVVLETLKDSTLITYTITDRKGEFQLKGNVNLQEANLFVTFVGYQSYEKQIDLSKSRDQNLGDIALEFQVESLGDVVVKGRAAPVIIKKDTLEFNAASFKTNPDATLEDLLKELPGAEVDADGQIRINGKPVSNILVNGKPFFSDDPTIATRNLTKELINKIQVVDTKTESEEFTGEAGDSENKTINITIDEDKNKGLFGRVAAGGGTDDRFEYAGIGNYFDNDLRLSLLGSGNNINSPGFSFGEIQKMFGNANSISINSNGAFNFGGRSFGMGQGIVNSRNAGMNFANDFGEKIETSADYFYSGANSFEETDRVRENILPENRFISTSNSRNESNTDDHSANLRFQAKIDSTLMVEVLPSLRYFEGRNTNSGSSTTRNRNGDLVNNTRYDNSNERNTRNFGNRLTATKRYGDKGGFIRLNGNLNLEETQSNDFTNSETNVFGDNPNSILRNQFTDGDNNNNGLTTNLTWRIPLIAKKLFVEPQYEYNTENRTNTQLVYGFDENTQSYNQLITPQSTDFESSNRSHKPEIGISYNDKKVRAGISAAYVGRKLTGKDLLTDDNGSRVRDIDFENTFDALEASANLNYNFTQKFSLWTSYRLSNNAPDVRQLSPYLDVSDPINTLQGNPDLNPTNSHRLNIGLNNYDWESRSGFYSYLGASFTNDQIVNRTTVDDNFVRQTTFTNVDGVYDAYASVSYNKDFKLDSLKTLKVETRIYGNINRFVNFFNADQYASITKRIEPSLGLRFTWNKWFEFRPEYSINFSRTTFNRDFFDGQRFAQHNARLRTTTFFPEWLTWENDIRYIYNPNVGAGFQGDAVFWNSSLAYSFINDKALVTFKVYDLLNQNTNARRNATQSYIEDVQSTVLQQYFMLSFSYKFNTLGKKGEVRENSWWD